MPLVIVEAVGHPEQALPVGRRALPSPPLQNPVVQPRNQLLHNRLGLRGQPGDDFIRRRGVNVQPPAAERGGVLFIRGRLRQRHQPARFLSGEGAGFPRDRHVLNGRQQGSVILRTRQPHGGVLPECVNLLPRPRTGPAAAGNVVGVAPLGAGLFQFRKVGNLPTFFPMAPRPLQERVNFPIRLGLASEAGGRLLVEQPGTDAPNHNQ